MVFHNVPTYLMDDSGRSVFPFFLEGDSLQLHVLVSDYDVDIKNGGQTQHFFYCQEKYIKQVTEGHREISIIFSNRIGYHIKKSIYFSYLRELMITYIQNYLGIHVIFIEEFDDAYIRYQHNDSPLFHVIGDGYFTMREKNILNMLSVLHVCGTYSNNEIKGLIDFEVLHKEQKAIIEYLATREVRIVRMREQETSNGLLQGQLVTSTETKLLDNSVGILQLPHRDCMRYEYHVTLDLYKEIEKEFTVKMNTIPLSTSTSIVLSICAIIQILKYKANISIKNSILNKIERIELFDTFLLFYLLHTIVQCSLPLKYRSQDDTIVNNNDTKLSYESNSVLLCIYNVLEYLPYEIYTDSNVITETRKLLMIESLRDVIDGRIYHALQNMKLDTSIYESDILKVSCNIIENFTNIQFKVDLIDLLYKSNYKISREWENINTTTTVQLNIDMEFQYASLQKEVKIKTVDPVHFLATWENLPKIDPILTKTLLGSLDYPSEDINMIVDAYTDGKLNIEEYIKSGKTVSMLKSSQASQQKNITNMKKDIITTTTPNITSSLKKIETIELKDDWDESEDDKDDNTNKDVIFEDNDSDDWDGEQEESKENDTIMNETLKPSIDTINNKITPEIEYDSFLGGKFIFEADNKETPYWNTNKPLTDDNQLVDYFSGGDRMIPPNSIRVRGQTRYFQRSYQDKFRTKDPKTGYLAYTMPSKQDLEDHHRFISRFISLEDMTTWVRNAIEIKQKKWEICIAARSQSTREHYIQSMNTPSKIILRDIIETENSILDTNFTTTTTITTNSTNNISKKQSNKKKIDIREKAKLENEKRQTQQAYDDIQRFINGPLSNPTLSLQKRIDKLDEKQYASTDTQATLYGQMEQLRMRIRQWKERIENRVRTETQAAYDAAQDSLMEIAARLQQQQNDLTRRFIFVITVKEQEEIQRAYVMLGFINSAIDVSTIWQKINNITLQTNNEFLNLATSDRRFTVGMSRSRFILQYAGHILQRNVKSAKDARVNGFYPDKWQRQQLDIVDNNESSLVVAPTSAGKTLVSFYTVDKILRDNKDMKTVSQRGIVVFIAPTFPLARQMESDISMRSKASVYLHDTRIQQPKKITYDVLITTPECFQNIILSSCRTEQQSKIRYVVFDEVHSIGSTQWGPIWERIFQQICNYSFQALSATVGGIENFYHWQQSMRQNNSIKINNKEYQLIGGQKTNLDRYPKTKVHSVVINIRWSHLHHYFYIPPISFINQAAREVLSCKDDIVTLHQNQMMITSSLPQLNTSKMEKKTREKSSSISQENMNSNNNNNNGNNNIPKHIPTILIGQNGTFVPIHPCSTVACENEEIRKDVKQLKNIEFSTSDMLQQYDTMQNVAENSIRFQKYKENNEEYLLKYIDTLRNEQNPDNYFGFYVEKINTQIYEERLKDELIKWYDSGLDTEILEVIDTLGGPFQNILKPLTIATMSRRQMWIDQMVPMLRELQQRDWFPAIIFCLDRSLCTAQALHILQVQEDEEQKTWEKEDDKRANRVAYIEECERRHRVWQKMQERKQKIKGSADASKDEEECERMGFTETSTEPPLYDLKKWNSWKVDERFSFILNTDIMNTKDLNYWESKLRGFNGQDPQIRSIFRGFGVHHPGVKKTYRDLIEVLFRGRHIKFVISTETLSLGVNMPCRTTIFAFTTVEQNPLNYRQMSGRAGRRGYDDKGQVIFFGINPKTACRLMTSSLSNLTGHFNFDIITLHRQQLRYYQIRDKTINMTNRTINNSIQIQFSNLLTRSFHSFNGKGFDLSYRIILIQYIRYMISYLHHLHLFQYNGTISGIAYQLGILSSVTNNIPDILLFGYFQQNGVFDRQCKTYNDDPENTATNVMIILANIFKKILIPNSIDSKINNRNIVQKPMKDINDDINITLQRYETESLCVFSRYLVSASLVSINRDIIYRQPYKDKNLPSTYDIDNNQSNVLNKQKDTSIRYDIRDPYSALVGRGDKFQSYLEQINTCRRDVIQQTNQLPLTITNLYEARYSSYLVDFYVTGDYDAQILDHGQSASNVWTYLDNFSRILQQIKTFTYKQSRAEGDDEDSGAEDSSDDDTNIISAFDKNRNVQVQQNIKYGALPQSSQQVAKVFSHIYQRFSGFLRSVDRATNIS